MKRLWIASLVLGLVVLAGPGCQKATDPGVEPETTEAPYGMGQMEESDETEAYEEDDLAVDPYPDDAVAEEADNAEPAEEDAGAHEGHDHGAMTSGETAGEEVDVAALALDVDPVCMMSLEEHGVAATFEYEGETYGFCAERCRDQFAEDPARRLEIYQNRLERQQQSDAEPAGDEE
jgi:YHS domain-containing protein